MARPPKNDTPFIRSLAEYTRLSVTVAAFMRLKMAAREHYPHWLNESYADRVAKLWEEAREFKQALKEHNTTPTTKTIQHLQEEAADLTNAIWMLVDWVVHYRTPDGGENSVADLGLGETVPVEAMRSVPWAPERRKEDALERFNQLTHQEPKLMEG